MLAGAGRKKPGSRNFLKGSNEALVCCQGALVDVIKSLYQGVDQGMLQPVSATLVLKDWLASPYGNMACHLGSCNTLPSLLDHAYAQGEQVTGESLCGYIA